MIDCMYVHIIRKLHGHVQDDMVKSCSLKGTNNSVLRSLHFFFGTVKNLVSKVSNSTMVLFELLEEIITFLIGGCACFYVSMLEAMINKRSSDCIVAKGMN